MERDQKVTYLEKQKEMKEPGNVYLYEAKSEDFLLDEEEEKIVRALEKVNSLWKKYIKNGGSNRLILFCGGTGCSLRVDTPSMDNEIVVFDWIRGEGGDGADSF